MTPRGWAWPAGSAAPATLLAVVSSGRRASGWPAPTARPRWRRCAARRRWPAGAPWSASSRWFWWVRPARWPLAAVVAVGAAAVGRWPASWPWWAGAPIDHVFADARAWEVVSFSVLDAAGGSDHRPVLAVLRPAG